MASEGGGAPRFLPQEIIRTKRDGTALDDDAIAFMARGIADGSVGDGQVAAFAMAVFFRGMSRTEVIALTRAMTDTGTVIDWSGADLPGPPLDKHSTGGVGDKVSLMLAPIVAACGGAVPMISGRGLGHTGGTLDKLDSIPGYDTAPGLETFRRAVREAGCAIIGQTEELAPADRRLYAVRDVTATVESIPLITASILSKKLAAGLSGLVMDVKVGSGAFARTAEEAEALARSIVEVANAAGLPTVALMTDMNQVLGRTAGNAVEVREAIDFLTGETRDPRHEAVTKDLCAELLVLGGLADGSEDARGAIQRALDSGAAAERFSGMVRSLGGPADLLDRPGDYLPAARLEVRVTPEGPGYVTAIDARALGLAVVGLGGGRHRADDAVDHAVGLTRIAALGDEVGPERPLCLVHARSDEAADSAASAIRVAMTVGAEPPPAGPVILERITGDTS